MKLRYLYKTFKLFLIRCLNSYKFLQIFRRQLI